MKGPLVVSFFRGHVVSVLRRRTSWAISEVKALFDALGASIVVISPESPAERDKDIERDLGLTLLYDRGNKVGESFGLVYQFPKRLQDLYLNVFHNENDIAKINGANEWRLPIPARYVVARDGTIFDAQADPDYRYRPEPAQTITALQEMHQWPLNRPSRSSTL